MTTAQRKALAAKHPDSWIPIEAGDVLEGKITDLTYAWSDVRNGGSNYPLLTVEQENGAELKVHAFGTVLYNEIMRQRPEIGDRVKLVYVGADESKAKPGQNAPEIYRVRVEGSNGQSISDRVYARLGSQEPGTNETDVPWTE